MARRHQRKHQANSARKYRTGLVRWEWLHWKRAISSFILLFVSPMLSRLVQQTAKRALPARTVTIASFSTAELIPGYGKGKTSTGIVRYFSREFRFCCCCYSFVYMFLPSPSSQMLCGVFFRSVFHMTLTVSRMLLFTTKHCWTGSQLVTCQQTLSIGSMLRPLQITGSRLLEKTPTTLIWLRICANVVKWKN